MPYTASLLEKWNKTKRTFFFTSPRHTNQGRMSEALSEFYQITQELVSKNWRSDSVHWGGSRYPYSAKAPQELLVPTSAVGKSLPRISLLARRFFALVNIFSCSRSLLLKQDWMTRNSVKRRRRVTPQPLKSVRIQELLQQQRSYRRWGCRDETFCLFRGTGWMLSLLD